MRILLSLVSVVLVSCSSSPPASDAAASKAYLEKAAAVPGATRTASGLVYRELRAGTGTSPARTDTVKVYYRGSLVIGYGEGGMPPDIPGGATLVFEIELLGIGGA